MTDETKLRRTKVPGSGRKKGSLNKATREMNAAIEAAMAQTDSVDAGEVEQATTFLKRVQMNKALPLALQMRAAEALLKHERPPTEDRTYVVRMPLPCTTMAEWLERVAMQQKEDAIREEWSAKVRRVTGGTAPAVDTWIEDSVKKGGE